MTILAFDPGLGGGFAWGAGGFKMPPTEPDIVQAIKLVNPDVVYIEKLPLGGMKTNVSAMAKLHGNAGVIRGAVLALGLKLVEIPPKEWQAFFHLSKGDRTPTEWKNLLKSEAQKRFPKLDVTLATADALLIYEYARSRNGS